MQRAAGGAAGGEVNGEGLGEGRVQAGSADPGSRGAAGGAYVVFGRTGGAAGELSGMAAGSGGFALHGEWASAWSGSVWGAAGDINGDGQDDIVFGGGGAQPGGRTDAGRAYIRFGGSQFAQTVALIGRAGAGVPGAPSPVPHNPL